MTAWRLWKWLVKQQHHARPHRRPRLELEALEDRTVPSSGLTVAPGYTVTTFATNPTGATQPDSIAVFDNEVFVGFGNGAAKDGSSGSSTIVEYTTSGSIVQTFSVAGHNDGLQVDPTTGLVWALQNEDANPNLVIINPTTASQTLYTFAPVANGGGFDDITFLHGNVYMSESNPSSNPNTAPAIVQATLSGNTVQVTPVLFGNATATNLLTGQQVTLNLQDPDSMTVNKNGNLVLTDQADNQIVTVKNPGKPNQSVTVLPLSNGTGTAVSVDDVLFPPPNDPTILMTDQATGTIYSITGPNLGPDQAITTALDIGELGTLNLDTGVFTPVVSGLSNPRGLAVLQT